MGSSLQYMEHRQGDRVALDVPVELQADDCMTRDGRVTNASTSGAFVETALVLPLFTRLTVRAAHGRWIDAFVARLQQGGMGVEWLERGSEPLLAIAPPREWRGPHREIRSASAS